ncbi:MAG: homoserine dehydrogenase [Thermomicrobiales bacterium]
MTRIQLIQVGIGTVGGAVLDQVLDHRERWRRELGLDVAVAAVVSTGGVLVSERDDGFDERFLRDAIARRRSGSSLDDTGATLAEPLPAIERVAERGTVVVMDAAAGDAPAALDAHALRLGGGVVLSNKAPLALPVGSPDGDALWAEAGPHGRLRYEATCGAGLPVISTLRSLLDTGDEIIEITGAVSGTLGAIFSDVVKESAFSAAVRSAKERGYTEPDPRDDLSGLDVARKALILARTLGRQVDLSEIEVESLVPSELRDAGVDEFLDRVSLLDGEIGRRAVEAAATGQTLKYVMSVKSDGPISVGLRAVDRRTVLGALQGPENVITFRTKRYDAYPLNVAGPGAGAAVTAAGMVADMLALAMGPLRLAHP